MKQGKDIQITLKGIVRNTPGTIGQDGELEEAVNLRYKDGAFRPVPALTEFADLNGYASIFIHSNTGYKHVLGVSAGNLYYIGDIVTGEYTDLVSPVFICAISGTPVYTQIGNVVNILDTTGLKYAVWYDGSYMLINTSFDGAQTDQHIGLTGRIDFRVTKADHQPVVYRSEGKTSYVEQTVKESITGLWRKAVSIEKEKGFIQGFHLLCTAVELYDGSYILHSNPVLIGQSMDAKTRYSGIPLGGVLHDYKDKQLVAYYNVYGIWSKRANSETGASLEDFPVDENNSFELSSGHVVQSDGDFVRYNEKGSVFKPDGSASDKYPRPTGSTNTWWTVSSDDPSLPEYEEGFDDIPAGTKYRFAIPDASGIAYVTVQRTPARYTTVPIPSIIGYRAGEGSSYDCVVVRRSKIQLRKNQDIDPAYRPLVKSISVFMTPEVRMHKDLDASLTVRLPDIPGTGGTMNFAPPLKTDKEIIEELMSFPVFYKVHELSLDEFNDAPTGSWIDIELKGKIGETMGTLEALPVDMSTHHTVTPQYQAVYNAKLHACDYSVLLSRGWPVSYLKYEAGIGQFATGGDTLGDYAQALVYALVEIKTDTGVSRVVRYNLPANSFDVFNLMPLLSYPDKRAKKITIRREYKGWPPVTERGVCWATHTNPTVGDNKLIIGSGNGVFDDSLTGLTKSTTYYLRAYAIAGGNVYYGEEKSFTTQNGIAVLSTFDPADPLAQVANSGGNITADGGSGISSRGVCWSTSPNPTILDSKTVDGTGTGVFYSEMTGLTPNTTYYVRAYATNGFDTYYGSEYSFTTVDGQERITLGTPSDLTYVSVKIPILVEEGSGALQFPVGGVCWNTTGNPTTADNTLEVFDDFGSFVAEITGLTPGTTYYFRGYATTEIGTSYTSQTEIETPTGLLEVETLDIDPLYVGDTWAHVRGTVNDPTESGVIEFGICYSLSNTTPTVEDSVVVVPGSPDLFTGVITGLIPGMGNYHARAYAINISGVYYGSVKTFYTNP